MLGCFGRSKKKYKEKKVGKGPGKNEEPAKIKKPQQVIDKDTKSCIVTNGDGPREIPSSERNESEGSGDTYHRHHFHGKQYNVTANVANFGDHGKTKVIKNDNSSRSSSDSNSHDSFEETNRAPPMGAPTSAGNQGQGGNIVNKIGGGTGNTFNFTYTGKNVQLGQNCSINYYQHKKEKKKKAERRKEREPEDVTTSCKESARIPTSSSCPDATSEVKVEKLQKSPNEASTADDQAIPVRHLGHPSGPSSGNMRAQFDETESVYNQRLLVDLAKSIGIVRSPYGISGTGFRVGSNYIMTAKHVKDDILNAAPSQLSEPSPPPRINHLSNAFIDFSYEVSTDEQQSKHIDDNLKFYFEPKIVYENDDMDTVILQLKPNTRTEYPPPLINFAELSDPNGQLYLIGHSKAEIKKTDKFRSVQLTNEEKTNAEQWSVRHVGTNGFIGIDNPHRVLLHCTFEKGASGSPGVWICRMDHRAYIVTMLLCGYPDWYYHRDCPSEKKHGIPHHHLVEQGVCMRSLCEDIKVTEPDLWREIFCFNLPMSQKIDDVEMKSM